MEPQQRQNLGTAPITKTAVNFDQENISNSSWLFLFKSTQNLVEIDSSQSQQVLTRDLIAEPDLDGRQEPPGEPEIIAENPPLGAASNQNFSFFTRLPVAFTVLERQSFSLGTAANLEAAAAQGNAITNLVDFLTNRSSTQAGTQSVGDLVTSNLVFGLDPVIYPVAIGDPGENEKIQRHELIIPERKTDFFLDQFDSINSPANAPMVFSYFENMTRYERCYIDASFLCACLYQVL